MPTILRESGFRVVIYTRDEHPPAHVHVWRAGGEAVIRLGAEGELPFLHEVNGMPKRDVRRALDLVTAHQDILLTRWEEING
jgi:hypothetical protein